MRGGGSLKAPKSSVSGYTLAEIIVVMLIIAVIVSVTIGITKAKFDNIISYTYYNAYSTLRSISTEMLADWNPKDPEYKQALNEESYIVKVKNLKINLFNTLEQIFGYPAYAAISSGSNEGIDKPLCLTPNGTVAPSKCPNGKWICPGQSCLGKPGGGSICNKSCGSGFTLDITSCSCKCTLSCGSGYKLNSSSCICEKLPCTNKPSVIPCGQSWDEGSCSLTGTVKTCPSGQHLNSSCNCVTDCPADLSPCNICNSESGIVSQNPAIDRTCSDETYEWSEDQCKCIPSPRTLPRKGMNFCKLFERYANIMSGSSVCSGSVISNGTTDFSGKSPDITLRNGLRLYNMHSDAGAISDLANNTQGGVYDGVPNTNSYGYTVYVDIDGAKGDSQLWSDVYPFYITLSGKIIPAYDTSNLNQSGGDSTRHLQVSAENENYAGGRRSTKWLAKSVSFKEGACIAGYVGDATPYCKNGTSCTKAGECSENYNSFCRVKQIQPVKFFF